MTSDPGPPLTWDDLYLAESLIARAAVLTESLVDQLQKEGRDAGEAKELSRRLGETIDTLKAQRLIVHAHARKQK